MCRLYARKCCLFWSCVELFLKRLAKSTVVKKGCQREAANVQKENGSFSLPAHHAHRLGNLRDATKKRENRKRLRISETLRLVQPAFLIRRDVARECRSAGMWIQSDGRRRTEPRRLSERWWDGPTACFHRPSFPVSRSARSPSTGRWRNGRRRRHLPGVDN
jgi:hypothetical protein